ncbi:hypothetical protein DOTSEDRAFT_24326 [Dothistroma septosporum NZE10]|uniref:Uncharacterized protein n=1 Tax=Dothistroma septosporum (strain NZE10 / CBS 128990) TaxID=675120 RepID=N1PPE9_DOTSN|nr:hypothetical protein DOTSEDRAFT_24326 [Dothistroma septosporum NZE10]
MADHTQPCLGHHPPLTRTGPGPAQDQLKTTSDKDSGRFDFCYRLRGWEQAQLVACPSVSLPVTSSPKATHNMHRAVHQTTLLELSFLSSSRISHTTLITPTSHVAAGQHASIGIDRTADYLGAALLRVICTGSVELVGAFIYAGADTGFKDVCGFGSMHCAARYGSPGIIRLLMRNGASTADDDQEGRSPLMHAIQATMRDPAECFVSLGAVLHESHIANAFEISDLPVVEMLLRYWRPSGKTDEVLDRLLLAAVK